MPITKDKFFKITSVVYRNDLEQAGFDASRVDDSTMIRICSDQIRKFCPDKKEDPLISLITTLSN